MNPIPKTGVINPKAEYIITVSWADNNPDDIDTYVQSPTGGLVWFRGKEEGFVHLDRDDRGLLNDTITVNNEKMSKSKDNILDPLEIIKEYGLDPLRYYLIKEVSFGNDGNISQDRLVDCINSDLANNFGNLCQRVTTFAIKNCESKIPKQIDFQKEDLEILNKYMNNLENIRERIDSQDINFYIDYIINSLFEANKYFNDQEPWKKKNDQIRLNTIVYTTLEIVRKISFLLFPIIPSSSLKALKIFDLSEKDINFSSIKNNDFLIKDSIINKIDILFKKIEKNND